MTSTPLILIIDDEIAILKTLQASLLDEGFKVEILSDGNRALSVIGELIPNTVLLDIFMPNCNGLKLLEEIKREYPLQKVIIISGFGNVTLAVEAIKKGASDFIEKPFNLDEILLKLSFLKETVASNRQNQQSEKFKHRDVFREFGIVGESFLFLELLTQIKNVVNLRFPLLVYGEYGTGKALFVRFIQRFGSFKGRSFTIVDCSRETEIKQEVFNSKGVIFFKNIDELGVNEQKKLLKFLESKKYRDSNEKYELRVIVSSKKSLLELVRDNKFNEALFYKLNITPIEIPSLNKRRYDIPLLIDYYLEILNEKYKKNISFDIGVIRYLRNRYWVGNVSELRILMEKIFVFSDFYSNQKITTQILQYFISEREIEFIEEQSFLSFQSFDEAVRHFEKKYLLYILRKSNFDLQQVSERLKLSEVCLYEKISKLNIDLRRLSLS